MTSGGDGTGGGRTTTSGIPPRPAPRPSRRLHGAALAVLGIGLVITASLTFGAWTIREDDEEKLLDQRAKEAAVVAAAAIPNIQTPLTSGAVLAEITSAGPGFQRGMNRAIEAGAPFISLSLWRVDDPTGPIVVIGEQPALATLPVEERRELLGRAVESETMVIENLLDTPERRLGYAATAPDAPKRYVVYGEAAFPRTRRANIDRNVAFTDLDYALYLGQERDPAKLLASSVGGQVPMEGRVATEAVPFGDEQLLITLRPRTHLGGALLARLPWLLGGLGLVITLGAAALTEWLIRRRELAEDLASELRQAAAENERLLAEQRTVASTLQHSLLPERLPDVAGLELAVRYLAGVEGVDIGGDWYDVVTLDDGRLFFVVGDVSGRGLRAATVMASLRYAIRAYAAQGDDPAAVLTKLSKLLSLSRDGSFATVLCGIIDVNAHEAIIASAGHPFPLLISNGQTTFVPTNNGVPVGVSGPEPYESVTASIPPRGTLLVFTDGLVERRGEDLDVGFERLRESAIDRGDSLEALLTKIVSDSAHPGTQDDTALLGIRWRA